MTSYTNIRDRYHTAYNDDDTCPICVGEMDATDKSFKPCKCGFQLCGFCYRKIKDTMDNKCPSCRSEYKEEDIRFEQKEYVCVVVICTCFI